MSVTNGVNLLSGLPGQSATQHAQPSALPANPALTSGRSALPKDQFVPSSLSETADATAQAAGLFTISKSTSSSASSDLLSTPSGASALEASSAAKTNSATAAIGANLAATGNSATSASSSSAGALSGSALPPTSAATGDSTAVTISSAYSDGTQATSTASSASGSVTTQTQLDSLNNALQALGLSAADIQQVDQVAQLTNDFSATSFTSLVYQLEALARNSSPQTQTPLAANANPSSNNAAAQPVAATSTSNSAPNASARTASGGGSSSNNRTFSLQSAQLQLNFTNSDGQSVQVQTPVLNSNSAPTAAKTRLRRRSDKVKIPHSHKPISHFALTLIHESLSVLRLV